MQLSQLVGDLGQFIIAQQSTAPFIFGISGGQGAGKSTLCRALTQYLADKGKSAVTLGLDDFYLSAAARQNLAAQVHPLCATRGVPGTHDVDLLRATLHALQSATENTETRIPIFSKSHDEGRPAKTGRAFKDAPM